MAHMCSAQGPGQALHLGGVRPRAALLVSLLYPALAWGSASDQLWHEGRKKPSCADEETEPPIPQSRGWGCREGLQVSAPVSCLRPTGRPPLPSWWLRLRVTAAGTHASERPSPRAFQGRRRGSTSTRASPARSHK